MTTIYLFKTFDKNIIKQCVQIGRQSLPIYYCYDSYKGFLNNKNSNTKVYIAKDENNKILGFIITTLTNENNTHLLSFAVDPKYRRIQIGSKLINHVKKLEKKYISLHVQKINNIAVEFYKKNKFVIIKEIKDYYSTLDNPEAYLMVYMTHDYLISIMP
jgi:ribosomal protein S18 acetylase RimI-like enzyme